MFGHFGLKLFYPLPIIVSLDLLVANPLSIKSRKSLLCMCVSAYLVKHKFITLFKPLDRGECIYNNEADDYFVKEVKTNDSIIMKLY